MLPLSEDRNPLYEIEESSSLLFEQLDPLQTKQLASALNYHALVNPGAVIRCKVGVAAPEHLPILGAEPFIEDFAIDQEIGAIRIRARGPAEATHRDLKRRVQLSHQDSTPETVIPVGRPSLVRRIYWFLEKRSLILLDSVREVVMRFRQWKSDGRIQRVESYKGTVRPFAESGTGPRAIVFGLHWLQTGGAERWAIESIRLAKEAGFLPVVLTDQDSVHPWLLRKELDACHVITLSRIPAHKERLPHVFKFLMRFYDVKGVVIHHSHYSYHALPWLKTYFPHVPVVDSLHIVEYLGGGYPGMSVAFDRFIDKHHVISPQLVTWLTDKHAVTADKLAFAPLNELTAQAGTRFKRRDSQRPFTIAFVGRLSRQKRPEAFVALVKALRKRGLEFRAILHGDGELRSMLDGLIARFSLESIIERRTESVPVSETLLEADALIITSVNEGLTLTTFEALAAGIPVLSTDVGSQGTLIPDEYLFSRPATKFIREIVPVLDKFSKNESHREEAWRAQNGRVRLISQQISASDWLKEQFSIWQM